MRKKSYFTISQVVLSQKLFSIDTDDSFQCVMFVKRVRFSLFLAIFTDLNHQKFHTNQIILNKSLLIYLLPFFSFSLRLFCSLINDYDFFFLYFTWFYFFTKVETITRHFCACVWVHLLIFLFPPKKNFSKHKQWNWYFLVFIARFCGFTCGCVLFIQICR